MATFDVDMYLDSQAAGTQPSSGFDPDQYLDAAAPQDRSLGQEALRKAEFAARGFSDSALETLGAIPDLTAAGLRLVGDQIGVHLAPEDPNFYTNAAKSGWRTLAERISRPVTESLGPIMAGEMSTADRAAYGGGRGVADAASIALPAAAISSAAKGGTVTKGVATTMASQPALQAVAGATGGAVGEATENPWLGLAAALTVPVANSVARRAITPFPSQLSPKEAQTADLAENMGIRLTAGQKTGSRPLQAAESQLAKLPFSAGRQQAVYDGQRGVLNRSVLSKAGIDADSLSPDLLDDAYRTLGQKYDDLTSQISVRIDRPFFDQIDKVANDYGRRLPTDIKPIFQSYVDDLNLMRSALGPKTTLPQTGGAGQSVIIEGPEFQKITSDIKAAARRAKNNPDLQRALNGLVSAVDGALTRSAGPETAAEFRNVNRLYRNLLVIDDAVRGGAVGESVSGDVPISSLKRAVRRSDPRGYARGRGDFADDVRVGEFIQDRIPNSGTPERLSISSLLTGGAPATGGMGMMAFGVDPATAGAAAVASYGLPPIAQALLQNQTVRSYLTNQAATGPSNAGGLAALIAAARAKDAQLNQGQP